jgi:tetratricopeptide (TPR) repeat protein
VAEILVHKNQSPSLIAHHYRQAGEINETAYYLQKAGAKAAATNALSEAIDYYNHAVKLVPSQAAYEALGQLHLQKGASVRAIAAFQQALDLAKQAQDVTTQARLLNNLAFVYWMYDHYRDAYRAAQAVLKLNGVSPNERGAAQSHLGMVAWLIGRLDEAETWGQKSINILQQTEDEPNLAGAYNRLGLTYFTRGKFAAAKQAFSDSLKIRRRLGDDWGQAYCLNNLGKVAMEQGNFERATSLLKSAQNLFQRVDSPDGLIVVYTNQGRIRLYQNQPNQAFPILIEALHLAMEIGKWTAYGLADIYLLIAQIKLAQGELERANAATTQALKLVETAGNQEFIARGQAMLAQIQAAQGQQAQAEQMYQKAVKLFKQIGSPAGVLRTQLSYAQFLAAQGQAKKATTLGQQVREEAGRLGLFLCEYIS